ncbi:MAG: glycosyltransferase, partial [Nanoarchaeota archaeon]|nr:glycosyltransferase [Nanoarchaeota archaeon]
MIDIRLPDTSLCAIVRDEAMNPAGGIIDFVDSTLPFVEQAVIVDTGSVDGTREMLEQLESEYRNLTIVDAPFTDYASARNVSLKYAKTKIALVLDADERLNRTDFKKLSATMYATPRWGYNLKIKDIFPNGEKEGGIHNPRLFYLHLPWGKAEYKNRFGKQLEHLHVAAKDYIKRFDQVPGLS